MIGSHVLCPRFRDVDIGFLELLSDDHRADRPADAGGTRPERRCCGKLNRVNPGYRELPAALVERLGTPRNGPRILQTVRRQPFLSTRSRARTATDALKATESRVHKSRAADFPFPARKEVRWDGKKATGEHFHVIDDGIHVIGGVVAETSA